MFDMQIVEDSSNNNFEVMDPEAMYEAGLVSEAQLGFLYDLEVKS